MNGLARCHAQAVDAVVWPVDPSFRVVDNAVAAFSDAAMIVKPWSDGTTSVELEPLARIAPAA